MVFNFIFCRVVTDLLNAKLLRFIAVLLQINIFFITLIRSSKPREFWNFVLQKRSQYVWHIFFQSYVWFVLKKSCFWLLSFKIDNAPFLSINEVRWQCWLVQNGRDFESEREADELSGNLQNTSGFSCSFLTLLRRWCWIYKIKLDYSQVPFAILYLVHSLWKLFLLPMDFRLKFNY